MTGTDAVEIVAGSVFLFIGLAACAVAAIRYSCTSRIFLWLGTWSAMYGAMHLCQAPAFVSVLPHWAQILAPYVWTTSTYLLVVLATLAFLELSVGKVRVFLQVVTVTGLAIAVAGFAVFVVTKNSNKLLPYNHLLATCSLLVLMTVIAIPKLSGRNLALPNRRVLAVGTLFFAAEAFYQNAVPPSAWHLPIAIDHLGFAALLLSFAYVAVQKVLANERRLLAVESELAVAREIQRSILPENTPEIDGLRISAAYQPMTAVAGDFYYFVSLDDKRVGILLGDVSGHGVPAALISSMIKVAMQSVAQCGRDPRAVMSGLNRILSGQLRGQFVTAAYLLLDTENGRMLYSAAGHPPLLLWRDGKLERIESNGLIIGVVPDGDYPVCSLRLERGDRFLLYTDGVTEPENAQCEAFGDARLEQVLRENDARSASELSDELLSEIRNWQPASTTQQDDMTLVVVDVT